MIAKSAEACGSAFTAALVAQDMPAALALLTEDVVFFYSNGSTIVGKEAFGTVMTGNWRLVENYKYQTNDLTWVAQTDISALAIYGFAWSGVVRGAEVTGSGRGSRLFVRQSDSRWLIAHEHLSNGKWNS